MWHAAHPAGSTQAANSGGGAPVESAISRSTSTAALALPFRHVLPNAPAHPPSHAISQARSEDSSHDSDTEFESQGFYSGRSVWTRGIGGGVLRTCGGRRLLDVDTRDGEGCLGAGRTGLEGSVRIDSSEQPLHRSFRGEGDLQPPRQSKGRQLVCPS